MHHIENAVVDNKLISRPSVDKQAFLRLPCILAHGAKAINKRERKSGILFIYCQSRIQCTNKIACIKGLTAKKKSTQQCQRFCLRNNKQQRLELMYLTSETWNVSSAALYLSFFFGFSYPSQHQYMTRLIDHPLRMPFREAEGLCDAVVTA